MGRWRPPTRPGSQYITPEGEARLRAELDQLWRVERPQVTQAVSEAAAMGDRSENAEYIYGKRRLREIDSRVRFLRKRLDGITVVDRPPSDPRRVFFGAWVALEAAEGPAEGTLAWSARSGGPCSARGWMMRCAWRRRPACAPGWWPRCVTARRRNALPRRPTQTTRTFLNCQGSSVSRSSGNRRPRSWSGFHSVYSPATGPRYGMQTSSARR